MNLELSENERTLLVFALGLAYGKLAPSQHGDGMLLLYERAIALARQSHTPQTRALSPGMGAPAKDKEPSRTVPETGAPRSKFLDKPYPSPAAPPSHAAASAPTGKDAAAAILAPPEQLHVEVIQTKNELHRILWAQTKNGQPPSKYEAKQLTVTKLDRRDSEGRPRMIVIANENGATPLKISLWDPALFAPVANKLKQPWTYYLTYNLDGKFTNLAGMNQ